MLVNLLKGYQIFFKKAQSKPANNTVCIKKGEKKFKEKTK